MLFLVISTPRAERPSDSTEIRQTFWPPSMKRVAMSMPEQGVALPLCSIWRAMKPCVRQSTRLGR